MSGGPTLVWVDGTIRDAAQATVGALDHGLTVGDGLFETMKVVDGTPFAMRRHLARLHRSAATLALTVPMGDDELRAAADATIAAALDAGSAVSRVRITMTGGAGPMGSERDAVPATVVIAAGPSNGWAPTSSVAVVEWVRNERGALTGAKTTSYAENVVALAAAHRRSADEAIFVNTVGALCEGTGSNVFVVHQGRLRTPSLATGCLAGITRELLLEVLDVDETDGLTADDLRAADEAFLTSSTRDVHPIATVDGQPRHGGVPGPVTRAAADAFAALQAASLDP